MPRIRSIHPDACDSEKLSMLSDSAERTFFRLLTHTDDEGRGEDRPKLLAAKLYPLHDGKSADTVDADLTELEGIGLLVRYEVGGKRFYAIPTFTDWQNPRHPTASKLPAPEDADTEPEDDGSSEAPSDTPTADSGNATADRRKAPAGVGVGGGVGGGEGENPSLLPEGEQAPGKKSWRDNYPPPGKLERNAYPPSFEDVWTAYPPNNGAKKAAYRTWRATVLRDGEDVIPQLLAAATHYRELVTAERRERSKIKHAETFFGPDEHWRTYVEKPEQTTVEPDRRSKGAYL